VDNELRDRCQRIANAVRRQSVRTALSAQDVDTRKWVADLLTAAARQDWAAMDLADNADAGVGRWRSMAARLRLIVWAVVPIATVLVLRFAPITHDGEPVVKDETFGALFTFALAWLLTGLGAMLDPHSGERTATAKNIADMISR